MIQWSFIILYIPKDITRGKKIECKYLKSLEPEQIHPGTTTALNTTRGRGCVLPFTSGFTPKWATKLPVDPYADEHVDYLKNGNRIVLLMMGGVAHSEIRVVHDACREFQRDILIGIPYSSTTI
jgi:hypothetical protein